EKKEFTHFLKHYPIYNFACMRKEGKYTLFETLSLGENKAGAVFLLFWVLKKKRLKSLFSV
ncbi:MAG: hypothetical protein KH111_19285, partial [Bacteroidales bacterium]|nr:hypothetical protein [Bacteroidales bacterium]